jgi:hypothetical protein
VTIDRVRTYAQSRLRGHTRLARADYIKDIIRYAAQWKVSQASAEQTARYLWERRWGAAGTENAVTQPVTALPAPAAEPVQDIAVPEPDRPLTQSTFTLQELLTRASEDEAPIELPPLPPQPVAMTMPPPLPPLPVEDVLPEAARRRAAKDYIRNAIAGRLRQASDNQLKYEQALLVRNRKVGAMQYMQLWAAAAGVTVQELAERIITEHEVALRKGVRYWAVEAVALQQIDAARGDDIDAIAKRAVADIEADE